MRSRYEYVPSFTYPIYILHTCHHSIGCFTKYRHAIRVVVAPSRSSHFFAFTPNPRAFSLSHSAMMLNMFTRAFISFCLSSVICPSCLNSHAPSSTASTLLYAWRCPSRKCFSSYSAVDALMMYSVRRTIGRASSSHRSSHRSTKRAHVCPSHGAKVGQPSQASTATFGEGRTSRSSRHRRRHLGGPLSSYVAGNSFGNWSARGEPRHIRCRRLEYTREAASHPPRFRGTPHPTVHHRSSSNPRFHCIWLRSCVARYAGPTHASSADASLPGHATFGRALGAIPR